MNPAQHLLLLHPRTVPEPAFQQQKQAMQYPKPFTVYQPIPGQSVKPLFTVYFAGTGPRDRRGNNTRRDPHCRPGRA